MAMKYFRRAYSSFAAHVFDIPPRFMVFLFLITLVCIPLTGLNPYYLNILIYANVLAVFSASWDLLVGRTGQISLGHALFFGIGSLFTAQLSKNYGLPIWITIPIAMLIGSAVAILVGLPSLRVKGPYLALVTMAFPLIIYNFAKWSMVNEFFGGHNALGNLPSFFSWSSMQELRIKEFYLSLLLLFVSSIILYKTANSKTGIVFVSILDDELASKACGINVTKYKLMSFVISGLFGALAGSIHAHLLSRTSTSDNFLLTMSFLPIIITFLGGIGTIYGPIAGAYVYSILDKYLLSDMLPRLLRDNFRITLPSEFEFVKFLIFSLIVLVLVIKWPRGLAKFTTDKLEDLEEARDLDERGPRIWKRYKKKKK